MNYQLNTIEEALADIKESIEELRYYREHFLKFDNE